MSMTLVIMVTCSECHLRYRKIWLWKLLTATSAKSIADDVFDTLGGDAMNAEAFKRYRRMVLEKGGSVPGRDALKEFLGREPSTEDFCKHLGMV